MPCETLVLVVCSIGASALEFLKVENNGCVRSSYHPKTLGMTEWSRVSTAAIHLILQLLSPVFERAGTFVNVAWNTGGEDILGSVVFWTVYPYGLPTIHAVLADDVLDFPKDCDHMIGVPLYPQIVSTVGAPTSEHLPDRLPL
jgi:hypothetical protein